MAGSASNIVSDFIQRFRAEIIESWMSAERRTVAARGLADSLLRDHMPQLLDDIGAVASGQEIAELPNAARHALERLSEGFQLVDLIEELALLRRSILSVWKRANGPGDIEGVLALDSAVDLAIAASVATYVDALKTQRERVLAKLESLLAASPVGIAFVDRDLRYLRINEAMASLNGRPAAEHIGHTVAEMLPDVAGGLEQLLRKVLESGQSILNLEITRPGATAAETRYLLANYFPVRSALGATTGVGGVVLDVTDAKRAEQALQAEQTRLQSIVEHAPAAIWVKDADGHILLANHQLGQALGHSHDAMMGRRSEQLLPLEVATQHQEHDRIVLAEKRALEVEEVVPSPEGLRTFLSIKFPIPGDPPLVGGIATEITERKRIEEELRVAVRTRDDMMAVVSHDLRNPLGTVQLSTNLLMTLVGGDHRVKRHLEVIHRACSRMESLIADLLDTASLREGRFQLAVKRERIEEVVDEAIDLQEPLAEEKGIRLVRSGEIGGVHVQCDRDRIIQVFENLIGNAVKFCRAGDVITVSARRAGEYVQYSVSDTGPGIDQERLARVFDAYWSAPQHRGYGSGLGLYIARGIVESHGGQISVASPPGAGATFTFTLPIDA